MDELQLGGVVSRRAGVSRGQDGGSSVDLELLRQASCQNLCQLLDQLPGKKDLLLDPHLMKPLDRICRVNNLKDHGVEKIYKLERTAPATCTNNQRVYFFYSDLLLAKVIADHVTCELGRGRKYKHLMIVVPRLLTSIKSLFEEEGLYAHVQLKEFPWELIPLDQDIISLEFPKLFPALFVNDDQSLLPSVARSIWSFQMLYGQITNIYGHGKYSDIVSGMVKVLFDRVDRPKFHSKEVTHLFIFDRNVDYTTPLLTPLTYESLLDETFGVRCGIVEFGAEVTGKEGAPIKYQLTSRDGIYNEIRHKHFAHIFPYLQSKARWLQQLKDSSSKLSVTEMKSFIASKLRDIQAQSRSLALHIGAAEVIVKSKGENFEGHLLTESNILSGMYRDAVGFIEDGMAKSMSLPLVLRLLCLYSHTQDGISAKEHRALRTQFLHSYGFEHMVTLHRLEKLGLFTMAAQPADSTTAATTETFAKLLSLPNKRSPFQSISKQLKLVGGNTDNNISTPTDPGYVFNHSYLPLACGVARRVLEKSLSLMGLEDALRVLPGKTISEISERERNTGVGQKVALVYFVGGVTYAEVAAFRLLGSLTGYRFILAGTAIIGGNSLLQGATINPTSI